MRANWKASEEISSVGGSDIFDYVERSLYKLRKFFGWIHDKYIDSGINEQ